MLGFHIAFGFTALITGLAAIFSEKGQKKHRLFGKIFFYSMLGVAAIAIFISIIKDNQFLLIIGIFAFYMDYSGYRAIKNKSLKPSALDWLILLIASCNSIFMLISGNTVLLVFGSLNSLFVISTFRIFIKTLQGKEIPKLQWLARHIGMMLGTYIATTTAFIVVNVKHVNPAWLPWLLPSIIGTPLIVYFVRKYTIVKKSIPEIISA